MSQGFLIGDSAICSANPSFVSCKKCQWQTRATAIDGILPRNSWKIPHPGNLGLMHTKNCSTGSRRLILSRTWAKDYKCILQMVKQLANQQKGMLKVQFFLEITLLWPPKVKFTETNFMHNYAIVSLRGKITSIDF